jgi:aspartate/methionine/tyrosine aminotransferase
MMIPLMLKKLAIRTGLARLLPMTKRLAAGCENELHYFSDRVLSAPLADLTDPATFPAVPSPTTIHLNLASPQFESGLSLGRMAADRLGLPPVRGTLALRSAIAAQESRRGRAVHPEREIIITPGATAGYASVLDAFINPGDRVVLFDPTSPMLSLGAKSRRAKLRWVPTTCDKGVLHYNLDDLSRAMRGAKLIVVADPGNPTGAKLSPEQREHLYWAANRSDVLIVVDETFDRYGPKPSSTHIITGAERRTLRLGSLTPFGLASARIGWVTGPESLIRPVTLCGALNAPYVSGLGQQIALRELTTEDELFGSVLEEMNARKRFTLERLTAMGLTASPPAAGYFVWVNVASTGLTGRAFAEGLLKTSDVLVGPGAAFGPSGQDFVRLSFAVEDGRLREGLSRLAHYLRTLRGEVPTTPTKKPHIIEDREAAYSRV